MEYNKKLFTQLAKKAKSKQYSSVIITLEPHPALFIHGRKDWAVFDNLPARLCLQRYSGIDTTMVVRLSKAETELGADWFLDKIREYIDISQLWLGARQSLGPERRGSQTAILNYAVKHNLDVVRLPGKFTRNVSGRGRQYLLQGSILRAKNIIGRCPLWRKPKNSEKVVLSWLSGKYEAQMINNPLQDSGEIIELELMQEESGLSSFNWIQIKSPWLRFVKGPSD